MSDVKILFNWTELTEFDGKLEISEPNPSLIEDSVKCQYCHEGPKQVCGFEKFGDEFYIARIMPDGSMKKEKAKFCPKCCRKLEAK